MLTNEELQALIAAPESDRLEKTESLNNTDKFSEAICAFANDMAGHRQPGYLLIGVKDYGTLAGSKISDQTLLTLAAMRTNGTILPQPALTVERYALSGGEIAVVTVQPSTLPPVRYKGNIHIRVGPRKAIANEQEERMLNERRGALALSFDVQPCQNLDKECSVDDLSILLFEAYRVAAVSSEVIAASQRSLQEQLTSLRFFSKRFDCPTNAAVILFGKDPRFFLLGNYVQYLLFPGTSITDIPINQSEIEGDLAYIIREIELRIRTVNTTVLRQKSGWQEELVPDYPEWAIRELLLNALMHRDFASNTPVRFYVFTDRIEIGNPGGLYGESNPENFPNVNAYRNPVIAEAMKILGFVNRYGYGVRRAKELLFQNGNPEPVFEFSSGYVKVTIGKRRETVPEKPIERTGSNINPDWLYQRTGDPFADTGAWALEVFQKEHPGEDILKLINRLAHIYVDYWDAKIHPFFLNSTITQPAFKGEKKIEETLKYFKGLLEETEENKEGYCRILGQKTKLFPAGRNNHILSGSGTFLNYHHAFEKGIMLSKEVLIRIFFVPLGSVFVGNRVAVINSNKTEIEKWFVKRIVQENLKVIGSGNPEGVLKSPYSNPANALFEFVKECIYSLDIPEDDSVEVSLYHFTNFGASPEISLYTFSARLFKFYRKILKSDFKADWQRFIRSYYRSKEATYKEQDDAFVIESKKEVTPVSEETVKGFYNSIYLKLLNDQDIRSSMTAWCHRQYLQQRPFQFYHIASLYQTFLKDMKKETLEKIERIADLVVGNDKRNRWLNQLRKVQSDWKFRNFLIDIIEDNNSKNGKEPVITLKEYVEYFQADGVYSREIRDLMLISIYEKLCDKGIVEELDTMEVPEETE